MGISCLIPKEIENLILLRYLSIASGESNVIPDSICNLWNLETLDMRNSTGTILCLPKGIWQLQKLRHLYLDGPTSLPRTNNEVGLPNLQVLTGVDVNQDTENLFAKVRFPNLRKLRLHFSRWRESRILAILHPLCHLQTLKIYNFGELSSPIPIQLTVTKITLVGADLFQAMKMLGSLTNLRILKLGEGSGCDLYCNESSFRQLEVFKMVKMDVLQWTMERSAMPNLQRLVIEHCELLDMLPDELWCLTALQDVEVLHPGPNMAKKLQQLQMRDECNLQVYPPLDTTN